jgi:cytochrome c5
MSLINTYKKNSLKGEIDNSQLILAAEKTLKPVGLVAAAGEVVAGAAGRDGKVIYDAVCAACHATGVLESPKLGDKVAWEARAANGLEALLASALNGKGSMPAKGGDPSITETELKNTILYMTKESGLSLADASAAPAKSEASEATTEEPVTIETPVAITAVTTTPEAPKAPEAPTTAAVPVPVVADTSAEGKAVYDTACFACHATGVAGSPKLGDKAAWAPRIAQGAETLYTTALNGKGAMPPKGGNMSLDDAKVKAAVDYMVSQSQ